MLKKFFNTRTILMLASIGGVLEMYDFVIYIFFATTLATLFFPTESAYAAMLSTLAIFATGYLFRPIGGIIFGHLGDRYGRRKSLLITITLMAVSMLAMALMPTYAAIGIIAPIFFCLFRILQGIALGGDLPGAIIFVNEYAENHRRGFLTGLLYFGVNAGILLASFIGMLFTNLLTQHALQTWGWRIAFLFGITLFIIGYYFRSKNIETPPFLHLLEQRKQLKVPLLTLFKSYRLNLCRAISMIALHAIIIVQLFLYMPIYLERVAHINHHSAMIYNTINIVIFSSLIPFFGSLSDRYGRKLFFIIASVLFFCFSYFLYTLINTTILINVWLALLSLAILSAMVVGIVPVTLAELFPTAVRNSAVGFTYNIGFGIFGGLSPIAATYLIHDLHSPEALSINLMVIALILLIFVIFTRFTKNQPLP